jgi:hypothetical protein
MGPNIQLQHNHETNKVHMEMQGDLDRVEDRDEETHHPDKAHEAAHKMFKPAIDLIHTTDKKTTNEEVEQVDEADVKSKPVLHKGKAIGETGIDTKTYRSPGQGEWYAKHHKSEMNTLGFHSREEAEAEVRAAHRIYGSVKEETEQVDEANMRFDPEAAAKPKSRDVQNFRMKDTNRRAGALSKKYVRRMTKLGGLGPNQTKKDTEAHMKANFGEEVGADKRDAGYKMSPAVRKAQAESDRLSKVVKPVQAGTLAAQRRRAEMKKEAVDLSEKEVINNKKSKAADTAKKMVNAAKGKMNKINLDPKVDTDSQKTKA